MKMNESKKEDFDGQVKEFESKERKFKSQKKELEFKEKQLEGQMKELECQEREFERRVGILKSDEEQFQAQMEELKQEIKQFEKEKEVNQEIIKKKLMRFESKVKEPELKEKQLEDRVKEFKGQVDNHESHKKNFETQVKELESKESELEKRMGVLQSNEKQLQARKKELKQKIKQFEKEKASGNRLNASIDEASLQLVVVPNEQTDEKGDSFVDYLLTLPDPSKDIFNLIQNPIRSRCGKGLNTVTLENDDVTMLVHLFKISPKIEPDVRDEAMKLAINLKSDMSENCQAGLGLLLILSIYELVPSIYELDPSFNEDEVLKLFGFAAQQKMVVQLVGNLGFADKVSGFVQNLIGGATYRSC